MKKRTNGNPDHISFFLLSPGNSVFSGRYVRTRGYLQGLVLEGLSCENDFSTKKNVISLYENVFSITLKMIGFVSED